MNKKRFKTAKGQFNYILNRACEQCKSPIPDKAHIAQKFCLKSYDENGRVRDCKTTFHRLNDKPEREIQAEYIIKNKAVKSRIEYLLQKHGYQVTTEMLDTYEIELMECLRFNIESSGILTTYFLNYQIVSNPFNNIHKISFHD